VRADYEERLHTLDGESDEPEDHVIERLDYQRLRAGLLAEKRAAIVALRDAGKIDDIVLRRVQAGLDAEEVRLAGVVDDE
jgi:CPA1 family monovalent cation:H+ antiporter